MILPVYIGKDSREPRSYAAAMRSLVQNSSIPVMTMPLDSRLLAERALLRRPQDTRGQRYDILSNAPASTEFAISRFLVPILQQSGWALFVDSDVIFLGDVAELFALRDESKALMMVQHAPLNPVNSLGDWKMDGQRQVYYQRKNWSSVMLFNCDHPANRRLSLYDVQERRGLDLHHFYWLNDSEIGALPGEWNWLVDVQPMPDHPKIAHFTLGTPEVGVKSSFSHLWEQYAPPPDQPGTSRAA